MTIPSKLNTFLNETSDFSFGYNEINFIQTKDLNDAQIGYRIDTNGNSLITGEEGDWQEEWVVIATDGMGDPFFVDIKSTKLTVFSAMHGEGSWETIRIADSLDNFKDIISLLTSISKNRTTPVELEENPVEEKEKNELLNKIKKQNQEVELWYWEDFFDNV